MKKRKSDPVFHDIARFRAILFDRMLKPHGLTMSQAWILTHLARSDGMTQSNLARKMDIGTVSVGGLIDRLEANGLVARKADPADRRANRICLTDSARPIVKIMSDYQREVENISLVGVPEDQVDTLFDTLDIVRSNLRAALNDDSV